MLQIINAGDLRRFALSLAAAELRATGEAGTENAALLLEQLADEYPEVATPQQPQR